MAALLRRMNGTSRRLHLNHSLILGGIIFAAASCDLNNPLNQDAGPPKDAGAGGDSGHSCRPTGVTCPICPNGYLDDANGCATCQCKPPTTCGPVCAIFCAYGNVLDPQGCPTCACNPPPTGPCSTMECGPGPAIKSELCPDGKTVAGPICLRDQTGVCGWRITTCPTPPPTCTIDQCPTPRPANANFICPDGKTVAGPACVPNADGTCGWTQVTCPICVDNVLCIMGDHWDGTLCKCVPDSPPPSPCPCAAGQICVTQIGGPAIPNPPPSHCETPDAGCLARVDTDNPCACLAAGDGKCTPASAAASCTCDNGIR
jgi:hypothetical protein